jgi:putative nucleotidyltransferase with HDIG domain
MSPQLAQDIEGLAKRLPAFPSVIIQLLDLLRNESVTLESLARIARNDPVVVANILSQANYLRRLHAQSDVTDPSLAASMIGINRLRRIVVTIGMNSFIGSVPGGTYLFQHSLAVAITAQEIAMISGLSPDHAYITGILHDVGQLCLHMLNEPAFENLYSQSILDRKLVSREAQFFGADHCWIGAQLAQHWNLPEEIHSAILTHHDDNIVAGPMQACIGIADTLARALDLPASSENRVTMLNPLAVAELELDWGSVEIANMLDRCVARYHHVVRE